MLPRPAKPVHQPAVAIAAPAEILSFSDCSIMSIRYPSIAISCVAEKIAMLKANRPITHNDSVPCSVDRLKQPSVIPVCVSSSQLFLWPSVFVNQGIEIRSRRGDHKKLKEYTAKLTPRSPNAEREMDCSWSNSAQAVWYPYWPKRWFGCELEGLLSGRRRGARPACTHSW